jgi:ABC-type branched-subunit amino acid transport system ATPase component
VQAVHSVSFLTEDARITNLLGSNGAGKTTALRNQTRQRHGAAALKRRGERREQEAGPSEH